MSSFTFLVSWLVDWAQRGMLAGTSTDMAYPASWPQGSQTSSKVTQGDQSECSKRLGSSCKAFLWPGLGSPRISFLPHSIGQASHWGQLRFKGNGIRLHLLIGTIAKNMRPSSFYNATLSWDLGKQSPWSRSRASGTPTLWNATFDFSLSPPSVVGIILVCFFSSGYSRTLHHIHGVDQVPWKAFGAHAYGLSRAIWQADCFSWPAQYFFCGTAQDQAARMVLTC